MNDNVTKILVDANKKLKEIKEKYAKLLKKIETDTLLMYEIIWEKLVDEYLRDHAILNNSTLGYWSELKIGKINFKEKMSPRVKIPGHGYETPYSGLPGGFSTIDPMTEALTILKSNEPNFDERYYSYRVRSSEGILVSNYIDLEMLKKLLEADSISVKVEKIDELDTDVIFSISRDLIVKAIKDATERQTKNLRHGRNL